eukprot:3252890-Rhodomonas_salina.1
MHVCVCTRPLVSHAVTRAVAAALEQVIAAILHMGNIPVTTSADGNGYIDPNDPNVVRCASMLGCDVQPFLEALIMRNIQVHALLSSLSVSFAFALLSLSLRSRTTKDWSGLTALRELHCLCSA